MTAMETATAFAQWAARVGIYPKEQTTGPAQTQDFAPLFAHASSEQDLRNARVQLITASDSANRITLFHAGRLLKRQLELLPTSVDGIDLVYEKTAHGLHVDNELARMAAGVSPSCVAHGRYTCGTSIGVGVYKGGGTLGCLVRDTAGELFGLTNNHVVGGCNHSTLRLPVVAPATLDMRAHAPDPFCIGHFVRNASIQFGSPDNVPHRQNLDAALFRIRDPEMVSSMQRDVLDTPTQTATPTDGMGVQKVGRTTGLTQGYIHGQVVGAIGVGFGVSEEGFNATGYFEPVYTVYSDRGPFAAPGDSGSLVMGHVDGAWRAVGIVFAVHGDYAYILPIGPVLRYFQVTLVGGHGCENPTSAGDTTQPDSRAGNKLQHPVDGAGAAVDRVGATESPPRLDEAAE